MLYDHTTIVSCSSDQTIIFWDLNTAKNLSTIKNEGGMVQDIKFFNKNFFVIPSANDGKIKIFELYNKEGRFTANMV